MDSEETIAYLQLVFLASLVLDRPSTGVDRRSSSIKFCLDHRSTRSNYVPVFFLDRRSSPSTVLLLYDYNLDALMVRVRRPLNDSL